MSCKPYQMPGAMDDKPGISSMCTMDGLIAVRGSHTQVDRAWHSLTLRGLASCTMLCLRLERGPSTRQRISLK